LSRDVGGLGPAGENPVGESIPIQQLQQFQVTMGFSQDFTTKRRISRDFTQERCGFSRISQGHRSPVWPSLQALDQKMDDLSEGEVAEASLGVRRSDGRSKNEVTNNNIE
jgi:hypothetical protein